MKKFNVLHSDDFLFDMIDITLYLLEQSSDVNVPRRFCNNELEYMQNLWFGL